MWPWCCEAGRHRRHRAGPWSGSGSSRSASGSCASFCKPCAIARFFSASPSRACARRRNRSTGGATGAAGCTAGAAGSFGTTAAAGGAATLAASAAGGVGSGGACTAAAGGCAAVTVGGCASGAESHHTRAKTKASAIRVAAADAARSAAFNTCRHRKPCAARMWLRGITVVAFSFTAASDPA
jgi:hypothetical protein